MKSMMEVCSLAITVDEKDAVPKCEMPALVEKDGIASSQGNMDNTVSDVVDNTFLATPMMPSINDFTLLKPISKGAYGSVYLAKKRTTGEYYAIKVLRKADMIAKNQISNVKAERAIMMAQTGSPFVVRLLYTFQSRTNLYLVMEYLNGGDCASLLKSIGTLPEDWARQYLAEVVLGIQDLHARDVVHRDLKPDNLLIDSEGHLKLTDFGLSKLGFLGRRVDQQAFIFGVPPFNAETPEKVFKNILSSDIDFYDDLREQPETQKRQWQDTMVNGEMHDQSSIGSNKCDDTESDIPYISPEARDFIKRLLCRDPKKRLGYNGAEELKKHPPWT
ncbi:hypothetical protein EV177_003746 [Coemansia sp. RSA 1804]|nr:hypothetical protein EV177_003746 [Coemansia sp. RSA 1804]